MTTSSPDAEALVRLSRLGTPVISDALLELGHHDHIAQQGIRPLGPSHVCAGPVRTAQFGRVAESGRDFGPLARFIDATATGEVLVLVGSAETPGALWGDICAAAAMHRGAGGVVLDGFTRDISELRDGALPMFARGAFSRDSLTSSNIVAVDVPVTVGGVSVRPGDVVVGDADGIVFFGAELTDQVLTICDGKIEREQALRQLLDEGSSLLEAMSQVGTM